MFISLCSAAGQVSEILTGFLHYGGGDASEEGKVSSSKQFYKTLKVMAVEKKPLIRLTVKDPDSGRLTNRIFRDGCATCRDRLVARRLAARSELIVVKLVRRDEAAAAAA